MFSNVNGCARATSYEECDTHYVATPLPRTSRRGATVWKENERPLDDARKHHYRLVQGDDAAYYDAVLYSTVMARYYRPKGEERRVCYNTDPRATSQQFMWSVTQHSKLREYTTGAGTMGWVPIGPGGRYSGFGADLYFVRNHLDISRSNHRPIRVPRMSDDLKAWKKEVKAGLAPVFELMKYVAAEEVGKEYGYLKGRPFRGYPTNKSDLQSIGWTPLQPLREDVVRVLVEMYKERVQRILETNDKALKAPALIRSVETSMVNALEPLFSGTRTRYEDLGQFPEFVPGNFEFV